MTEKFYLNKKNLPTIPVPHDCVIDEIKLKNDLLIFTFEQDISYHDSIKYFKPDANSLVIKYHLVDNEFKVFEWQTLSEKGCFVCIDNNKLFAVTGHAKRTEYIGHFVAYNSMIIDLCAESSFRLEIETDYVEYEWEV